MREVGPLEKEVMFLPKSLYSLDNPNLIKSSVNLNLYPKLESIIQLRSVGLPTLPGFVTKKITEETIEYLNNWMDKLDAKRLSLRFDSPNPEDHKKLMGSNPNIDELVQMTEFVKPPVVAIILAENDRFNQNHSVLTEFASEYLRFEIIGCGFDAADITRGNISPHEYFLICRKSKKDFNDELSPSDVIKHHTIDPNSYSLNREKRLRVIYSIIQGGLGKSIPPKELTNQQKRQVKKLLQQRNSEIPRNYSPLGFHLLQKVYNYVKTLDTFHSYYKKCFNLDVKDKVLSASFLKKYGLVFWDLYGADKYVQR